MYIHLHSSTSRLVAQYSTSHCFPTYLYVGGTERQYSHMDFSPREEHLLASVGGYPDYMLTVWDWTKQSIVLRSKAFSQDIYRVSFSPKLPGQLTTSGTGHIRFWKMSSTFTGLKLQGYLGKFGRTELSDISGEDALLHTSLALHILPFDGSFFFFFMPHSDQILHCASTLPSITIFLPLYVRRFMLFAYSDIYTHIHTHTHTHLSHSSFSA